MYSPYAILSIILASAILIAALSFLITKIEIFLILFLVAAAIVGGFFWKFKKRNVVTTSNQMVARKPNYAIHYAILREFQEVAELAVVRKTFHEIVNYNDSVKAKIPFTDCEISVPGTTQNLLMEYNAILVCGCKNLDAIKVEKSLINNCVRIVVPYSQVLDHYVESGSVKVHDQSEQIFASSIDLEKQDQIMKEHLDEIMQREIENGLLEKSNQCIEGRILRIAERNGVHAEILFMKKELPPHSQNPTASYLDISDLQRRIA